MFTASHNPAQYNGIKMCRAYAVPLGLDTGLSAVRDLVAAGEPAVAERPGTVVERDVLEDYAAPPARPWRPVTRAPARRWSSTPATGWPGTPRPAVLGRLDLDVVPLYYDLDGTFPNHEANPIEPANLADLQARGRARPAPTSGWPSTATPTAASSSTSAARSSARRCSPR